MQHVLHEILTVINTNGFADVSADIATEVWYCVKVRVFVLLLVIMD